MSSTTTDRVIIGKFGRPHGVRGEVRFFAYNPDSGLVQPGTTLFVDERPLVVEGIRMGDRFHILELRGVSCREDAEILTNHEAWVPRAELPEPGPDEFYLVDIIGFDVVGRERASDEPAVVGRLQAFMDSPSVDIMIVTGPRIRGRLLVPMVDETVEAIDHETRAIRLHPFEAWYPEGETALLPEADG